MSPVRFAILVLILALSACSSPARKKANTNAPLALNSTQINGFYSKDRFAEQDFESYYNDDRSYYVVCQVGDSEGDRGQDAMQWLLIRGLAPNDMDRCCRMICPNKVGARCMVSGN